MKLPNPFTLALSSGCLECRSLPLMKRMRTRLLKMRRRLWKTWSRCPKKKKWSFWRRIRQSCWNSYRTSRQRWKKLTHWWTNAIKKGVVKLLCIYFVNEWCTQLTELKEELQPLLEMVKDGRIPQGKVSCAHWPQNEGKRLLGSNRLGNKSLLFTVINNRLTDGNIFTERYYLKH